MPWSSGGDPGGPAGPRYPTFMDTRNEFGRLLILQMTGKCIGEDQYLPLPEDHFMIGMSIEKAVGQIDSAATEGRGARYILRVRNPAQAEKLLALTSLMDGTQITIRYHPLLNSCKCVIIAMDLIKFDEQVLKEKLESQGVKDVKMVTMKRDGQIVKTPVIILTFRTTTYPTNVKVGLLSFSTRPFYPNPALCFGCFQYGHVGKRCPGPKRCYNCSEEHEMEKDMQCEKPAHCRNCNGDHRPSNRKCPTYQKENKVIRLKIDHNLSYDEARKRIENGSGTYAAVTAQSRIDNSKIEALQIANKKKDEEIAKLSECVKEKCLEVDQLLKKLNAMETYVSSIMSQLNKLQSVQPQETQSDEEKAQSSSSASSTKNKKRKKNRKEHAAVASHSVDHTPQVMSPPPKRTIIHTSPSRNEEEDGEYMDPEELVEISDSDIIVSEGTPPHHLHNESIHK